MSDHHNTPVAAPTDGEGTAARKLSINEWAEEDRPREKFAALGPSALTNAELLAILIGSGTANESAVDLMKRLLADCRNNLNTLGKMTMRELTAYKGVGPAKAITIMAACELGKRRQAEKAAERPRLDSAAAIYDFMVGKMQDSDVEMAWILLMNNNYKLIKDECISHGGISETAVDVRIIMREALLNNATVVVLCHNHPSGNAKPSGDDDRLTKLVKQACQTMRIHFADHIIITDGRYFSYNEEGRL